MDRSPNLNLPYLAPAQAQKHVTVNEALRALDALVRTTVVSTDRAGPPDNPAEGEAHVIPTGAETAWGGSANAVAVFQDGAWRVFPPSAGWMVFNIQTGRFLHYDGADWLSSTTEKTDRLGVNTAPDATLPLVVSGPGTLLTADTADHRLTVNKVGSADTASLVFQSAFSGRAELGLAGVDDLSLKVSGDDETWATALSVRTASGVDQGWIALGHEQPERQLHIRGSNAGVRLQEAADSYFDLVNTQASQTQFNHVSAAGAALIDFNPQPLDGAGDAFFRFFRATQTTGSVRFDVHVGDGSAAPNARLAGNGNSFLAAFHGRLGVGTSSPQALLDVAGPVRVGAASITDLPTPLPAGQILFSDDAPGGATLIYSDGSHWRDVRSGDPL
ncbi:MAG: DUF2793 domain-containing protein [Maricaulaceae bacterium]